jgi:hypothetical protein
MESSEQDSVHGLLVKVRTGDGPARVYALQQLPELSQFSPEHLDAIISCLKDQDPVVRLEAELVFRRIGSAAIPYLLEALEQENVELRRAAISALGSIGPAAHPAVPALRIALDDEAIAPDAAEALNKITPPITIISQLDHYLGRVMPLVLVLGIMLLISGLIYSVFRQAGRIVMDMAVGFCLIGGSFGGILRGSRWGRRGAVVCAFLLAFGGALVGAGIGYVAGSILGPVIQSLQLQKNP